MRSVSNTSYIVRVTLEYSYHRGYIHTAVAHELYSFHQVPTTPRTFRTWYIPVYNWLGGHYRTD